MQHRIILSISDEELVSHLGAYEEASEYNRIAIIRDFGTVEDNDWLNKIEQAENAHEMGFNSGYRAAIHDALIPGSRAFEKLADAFDQADA